MTNNPLDRFSTIKRSLPFVAAALWLGASAAFATPAAPTPVYPEDSATGISQAPGLKFYSVTGATVQYRVQVDDDSGFGTPIYDYDQVAAQTFAEGMFAGRDGTKSVASDAYLGASTATFSFYSGVAYTAPLSPNAQYWYRACVSDDAGSTYSGWSTPRSFTTGELAQQYPMNSASISSVVLSSPTAAGTMNVTFHIRSNKVISAVTANGGAYNTTDWIIVKFSTQAGADWSWYHAKLASGGSMTGSGASLTLASDLTGAFINHTATADIWSSTVTLIWDYKGSGALVRDSAIVKVYTIPMVKIPQGSFVYNAGGLGGSHHNNYGGLSQVTVGSANDIPTGAASGWPNGFNSFYIMRYPVTQGLYADYLNYVSDYNANILHYNTFDSGYEITYAAGNPYGSRYNATYPNRAMNYLSSDDLWRWLSWAALRPLTEMEYQKASRDLAPDARTYPWGDEEPLPGLPNGTTYFYTPPNEGGNHTKYYMNFGNQTGGEKVLDVGRYMSGDVYRTAAQTGASPYGVADLGGQVWNQVLNCQFTSVPTGGNGSYFPESYANWPVSVPSGDGSDYIGIVGGNWWNAYHYAKISIRTTRSNWSLYSRYSNVGGRGGRTP